MVGANRYSQLEKIGATYTYVGFGSRTVADQPGRLAFRINDNVAGNGGGCFTIGVQVFR